jgi:hypothetical protein
MEREKLAYLIRFAEAKISVYENFIVRIREHVAKLRERLDAA